MHNKQIIAVRCCIVSRMEREGKDEIRQKLSLEKEILKYIEEFGHERRPAVADG